jgi:hypothetical protein
MAESKKAPLIAASEARNNQQGWIKLDRDLLTWPYYRNSEAVHLLVHLILKANHSDQYFEDTLIRRGQLMTGRKALSRDTGLSERKIRTLLLKFKKAQILTTKATSKFSIITLLNYDVYQSSINTSDQQNSQQATSKRPASDHKQECIKNDNNEKEGKGVRLSFSDVESFFIQHGKPAELAQKFFETYKSGYDTKGNPITDWQAKAQKWFETNPPSEPKRKSIADIKKQLEVPAQDTGRNQERSN